MKTKNDYITHWNRLKDDKEGKDPNAAIMNCVSDMAEELTEISSLLKEKIEEQKQAIGTCSECGLKKKFWNKMLCAEGKTHREE